MAADIKEPKSIKGIASSIILINTAEKELKYSTFSFKTLKPNKFNESTIKKK
ncbi:hypothetical protein PL321_10635 [Caloramator sp. mosi_1]|uniref:hypothetical protein n=1 Tax=Caloramator sp. mosi_1 TaxID=3023090 RepID=UPI0023603C01|nr:hypothetical protein [Caloramator sp. mosi_1]WDC83245.1 hypothetical protein PL321_10635 [Caloramator sp. mosi_1]